MPTYDYACDACEHQFEEFQSITAEPLRKCPKCGKSKLRRLIGAGGGVIFKGSGFYSTDYRSESYKKAAESDAKPASTDKPADAAKPAASSDKSASESKSAAAPEKQAPQPPSTARTDSAKATGRAKGSKSRPK